jgi:hypothetical protein
MPQKKKHGQDRKPAGVPISAQSTTLTEKPKRGRRTISDNFLLGTRNAWAALLEESWSEIGWPLLRIRDRRNSTIEDVRKAFEPVKVKPHNSGLATAFYSESPESANPSEIRKNRVWLGNLGAEIHQTQVKRDECQRSCQEVEAALKEPNPGDADAIKDEGQRRLQRLLQLEDDLRKLQSERDTLDVKVRDQEAHVSRSELLDYLHSGRYAINPQNLANALAGVPWMKWRQSFTRCSAVPFNQPRLDYSVFEAISKVWRRRSDEFEEAPVQFFRAGLLKLSKKLGYTRQFLREHWHDLKLAIGECWQSKHEPTAIPFVITSTFMRNVTRQKNPAERILAERDKLEA